MISSGPPEYVIEAARVAACQSPCAKSKRGAALFNREFHEIYETREHITPDPIRFPIAYKQVMAATGFNGQPEPFTCSGSDVCRRDCGKLCLHAEERAIRAAGALDDVSDLELVHVKVVDGKVVPGGGPSCWQCSRLVVEVKLRGVWLFEFYTDCPSDHCPMCTGEECNLCGAGQIFDGERRMGQRDGTACEHAADQRHQDWQPPEGVWQFYEANQFHVETMRNEMIGR